MKALSHARKHALRLLPAAALLLAIPFGAQAQDQTTTSSPEAQFQAAPSPRKRMAVSKVAPPHTSRDQ